VLPPDRHTEVREPYEAGLAARDADPPFGLFRVTCSQPRTTLRPHLEFAGGLNSDIFSSPDGKRFLALELVEGDTPARSAHIFRRSVVRRPRFAGVLTDGADTKSMSALSRDLTRAATIGVAIGAVLIVCMVARGMPEHETPWEFFRFALARTDSVGKAIALVFFTTVFTFMNLLALTARLRLGLPIVLLALVALAALSPAVRQSRLARCGFALVGAGVLPLVIAGRFDNNPLGFGFLFAFLTPIGGLLIVSGVITALTTRQPPEIDETPS